MLRAGGAMARNLKSGATAAWQGNGQHTTPTLRCGRTPLPQVVLGTSLADSVNVSWPQGWN